MHEGPALAAGVMLLVPMGYLAAALLPAVDGAAGTVALWRRARAWALAAGALAVVAAGSLAITGPGVFHGPVLLPLGGFGSLALSARLDVLTAVMLLLVTFVGLAILQFSRAYLDGDRGQRRYVRWLMATLAAVTLLVVANNLLLLALAWIATSLALHQLLTFYGDRPQALIAAHKKFIASRVADACLLGAVALVGGSLGSLELDEIFAALAEAGALPPALQGAAVLFAAGAALKCAQLPFHGWLIQVMEAPTPVSALLHAGIVNIGGFLMIRLAPLMLEAGAAQAFLVAAGTATAVIAALVMSTRVSIKVALAWSTCAQMGFMLLQCGLGAYSLALLHLVAHSLYKAHAFLSSGSVVEQWRAQALAAPKGPAGIAAWLGAALAGLLTVAAVAAAAGASPAEEPALWALAFVVSLALTPLVVRSVAGGTRRLVALAGASAGVATLYFGWHGMFGALLAPAPEAVPPGSLRLAIVIAGFALLFAVYAVLSTHPHGRVARALYAPLYAGLYLDELFTRLTFRVWPAKRPAPAHATATSLQRQEA